MIVKFLGIMDAISAILMIFAKVMPDKLVYVAAIYLILKGGVFALGKDFLSFFDIAAGCYLLFLVGHTGYALLTIPFALYLLIKGGISLF